MMSPARGAPKIFVVGSFAVGMTIQVSHFPSPGETVLGSEFDMGPGGKGSNQAVGAARLGARASLLAMIGDDQFGNMAVELWSDEGVDQTNVHRSISDPTGAGFIVVDSSGENEIVLDPGANSGLAPSQVEDASETVRDCDVVLTVLEIPVNTAIKAMELAHRFRKISILNPAPAQRIPYRLIENVDFITPNETELRTMLGLEPESSERTENLARLLKDKIAGTVVTTMGEKGAFVIDPDGHEERIEGVSVNVVDTTGAGDAFNAGLAVGLGKGDSIHDSVVFACKCGAYACTKPGVIPALPNSDDVLGTVSGR